MPPPIQQPMAQAMPVQPNPMTANPGVSNPQLDAPVGNPAEEQALQAQMMAPELEKRMAPDEWMAFQQRMQGLPPEERTAALLALATDFGLAGQNAQADMSRADALRSDIPQGRTTGSNSLYQSANPLEFLAAGMNNMQRRDEYKAGKEARGAAADEASALRQSTMADILRQ